MCVGISLGFPHLFNIHLIKLVILSPDVNIEFNGNLIYFIGFVTDLFKICLSMIIQNEDFYSCMWHDVLLNVK